MKTLTSSLPLSQSKSRFLKGWGRAGSWAVLDQGLFAGGNFLVNILLARWLSPAEYGAFAVAYAVFLLLAAAHTAVITEPMVVFGAGKYATRFSEFFRILLIYGHGLSSAVIALSLGGIALACWYFNSNLAAAFAGLAVSSPFILLWWVVRQSFYARFLPRWALVGSLMNFVSLTGAFFFLAQKDVLNQIFIFAAMGLAGLSASIIVVLLAPVTLQCQRTGLTPKIIFLDHWSYGSWNILATGAYWVSGQSFIVLSPLVLGLSSTGILAAIGNLFRPLHVLMQSASLMLLPSLSAFISEKGFGVSLIRKTKLLLLQFVSFVFLYGMIIFIFGDFFLQNIYEGKYNGFGSLLGLFALAYTASAGVQILTLIIKALGKTQKVLAIWGCSAVMVLVLSIPMMMIWGLNGALLIVTCSYLVAGFMAWIKIKTLLGQS